MIITSLTLVLSTDIDIEGVPSMYSRYFAKIKLYGMCMKERGVHCIKVHRSKSEDIVCRLYIDIYGGRDF